jgi:hypothetical protein
VLVGAGRTRGGWRERELTALFARALACPPWDVRALATTVVNRAGRVHTVGRELPQKGVAGAAGEIACLVGA